MAIEREVEGDLFLQDIGQGFGFRPGTFDGAISISVLQWLLNADSNTHSPPQRLTRFFTTLHSALKNPSRAVFQFYPNSDDQVQLITQCAQRAGFGGGIVVDYPNSRKARKMYLCLMVGQQEIPKGIDGDVEVDEGERRKTIRNERRRKRDASRKKLKGTKGLTGKEWVLKKKELYRTRGKEAYVLQHSCINHLDQLTPGCHGTPSTLRASVVCSSNLCRSVCTIMRLCMCLGLELELASCLEMWAERIKAARADLHLRAHRSDDPCLKMDR